jgi:GGDEF domain-containing protein
MLTNTDDNTAEKACERFRKLITDCCFDSNASPVRVTVSIGFASLNQEINETPLGLMEMASRALGEAKSSGRDCVMGYC